MALMDKLFKIQHQKSLDRIQKLQMPFRRILTKLERLSPGGVIDYDFMSQKDEEGNNTGTVVKKIGYSEYWQKKTELYEAMFDGDVKQEYIKKNPNSKSLDNNSTLKIPPEGYILPKPKPKIDE